MPSKKSARRLKELCMDKLHCNLNTLQHEAKCLPKLLINDLFDKCCKHTVNYDRNRIRRRDLIPTLSSDLFLHARTKILLNLDIFDQPIDKIVGKISLYCKNLQELELGGEEVEHIKTITMNNAHIWFMNLESSKCTNYHLSIIGKQCPQLRQLCLSKCDLITDDGIIFLPKKLEFLYLPDQITLKERLNTLDRFAHLKRFHSSDMWSDLLKALANSLDTRCYNQTYEIEFMPICHDTSYDIPRTIRTLFPKIRKMWFKKGHMLCSEAALYLESANHNLLTYLFLHVSSSFVRIAAHLCPALEFFHIETIAQNQMIDDRYLEIPKCVPFKYLQFLDITDQYSNLSRDDFKLLLANCWKLEKLIISSYNQLTNQLISEILNANPLKCVKLLKLCDCQAFSIESLWELLQSLDSLMDFDINHLPQISPEERIATGKLIADMNLDLHLTWDYKSIFDYV